MSTLHSEIPKNCPETCFNVPELHFQADTHSLPLIKHFVSTYDPHEKKRASFHIQASILLFKSVTIHILLVLCEQFCEANYWKIHFQAHFVRPTVLHCTSRAVLIFKNILHCISSCTSSCTDPQDTYYILVCVCDKVYIYIYIFAPILAKIFFIFGWNLHIFCVNLELILKTSTTGDYILWFPLTTSPRPFSI
jgi:hypothetical protein